MLNIGIQFGTDTLTMGVSLYQEVNYGFQMEPRGELLALDGNVASVGTKK